MKKHSERGKHCALAVPL